MCAKKKMVLSLLFLNHIPPLRTLLLASRLSSLLLVTTQIGNYNHRVRSIETAYYLLDRFRHWWLVLYMMRIKLCVIGFCTNYADDSVT